MGKKKPNLSREQRSASHHGHGYATMKAREAIKKAGGRVDNIRGWDATHRGVEKTIKDGDRVQRELERRLRERDEKWKKR